jgi:acetolactate synthase-1/2/3 large subunit
MLLTGAQIIAECLLEQGADTVFGYPGGAVLNIYDALYEYRDKIRHILTCHEQGAAHAADGYARSTGKAGVVIATSGPGATNLVTGIATAYLDSSPLVAITGNVATSLLGKDSFQEVDITGITVPITKHNFIVKDVNLLADTLRDAFKIAQSGRPGPVLVDIPKDVTGAKAEYTKKIPAKIFPSASAVSNTVLDKAAALIATCERPFIFAGGGVTLSGANEELFEFAKKIDAPVATSLMGLGCFPASDSACTGMIGMHGTKASGLAVSNCDLLIALGTRFSDRVTCNAELFAHQAKILQIDIDPAEINKNISVDFSVTGDLKQVLKALNARLQPVEHKSWNAQVAEWKNITTIKNSAGVTPSKVINTLNKLTNGDAIISTEVGQHQMWAAQYYGFEAPRRFITSGGLGTMGFGLGAAIGAQVGNPGRHVINVAGDGSFYMNLNELATISKYEIPVIELVMNNGVLGMVRQWQKLFYGSRFSHTTLERGTDLMKLAQAFGVLEFEISTESDIEPVLKAALESQRPCLINCLLDMDENVLPMVPAGAPIDEPVLDM